MSGPNRDMYEQLLNTMEESGIKVQGKQRLMARLERADCWQSEFLKAGYTSTGVAFHPNYGDSLADKGHPVHAQMRKCGFSEANIRCFSDTISSGCDRMYSSFRGKGALDLGGLEYNQNLSLTAKFSSIFRGEHDSAIDAIEAALDTAIRATPIVRDICKFIPFFPGYEERQERLMQIEREARIALQPHVDRLMNDHPEYADHVIDMPSQTTSHPRTYQKM